MLKRQRHDVYQELVRSKQKKRGRKEVKKVSTTQDIRDLAISYILASKEDRVFRTCVITQETYCFPFKLPCGCNMSPMGMYGFITSSLLHIGNEAQHTIKKKCRPTQDVSTLLSPRDLGMSKAMRCPINHKGASRFPKGPLLTIYNEVDYEKMAAFALASQRITTLGPTSLLSEKKDPLRQMTIVELKNETREQVHVPLNRRHMLAKMRCGHEGCTFLGSPQEISIHIWTCTHQPKPLCPFCQHPLRTFVSPNPSAVWNQVRLAP